MKKTIEFLKNKIQSIFPEIPETVVVLGSGLGDFKKSILIKEEIPYNIIPGFHASKVEGHENSLFIGTVNGIPIIAMNGRYHYYEGFSMADIAYPIRVFKRLGIKNLILSAAVGSLYVEYEPGTIVTITDHIKFFDESPLRGSEVDDFGTRFPDMSNIYKYELIEKKLSKYMHRELNLRYVKGVYSFMPGPQYETPAEIRALKTLGATVTGMSTVPEAITACYCGMNVYAYGAISNYAAGVIDAPLSHEEVIENGKKISKNFSAVIMKTLELINCNKKGRR